MPLDAAQLRYLEHHRIGVSETLDASGLASVEWKQRLRVEGKIVAYGVSPCQRAGHTLRARGGCIQCSPATIAFARRSRRAGHVYVALSPKRGLIKIGFSADDPDNRIYIANLEGYGGVHDWRIFLTLWSDHAGKIEQAVQQSLSCFIAPQAWVRNGRLATATEIFDCGAASAVGSLIEFLDPIEVSSITYR